MKELDPSSTRAGEPGCSTCCASCCRLEVMLLTDTGVPPHLTATDAWGGAVMIRLDDGWCAALDRQTLLCTIYPRRPLVCRELKTGSPECLVERNRVVPPRQDTDINEYSNSGRWG